MRKGSFRVSRIRLKGKQTNPVVVGAQDHNRPPLEYRFVSPQHADKHLC